MPITIPPIRLFCQPGKFAILMRMVFERSAGGLVLKKDGGKIKILMVQVKNLQNQIVWTFPKGHIERGETARQAALREVEEETGWKCELKETRKPMKKVQYFFKRGKALVKKQVVWFRAKPIAKVGKKDPAEIRKVRWVFLEKAKRSVVYNSDKKILKKLDTRI